jgi:integrase
MEKSSRKKFPLASSFAEICLQQGITSPSQMAAEYNRKYGLEGKKDAISDNAFTKALRRKGITAEKRLEMKEEVKKETVIVDIMDMEEVKNYFAKFSVHYHKHHLDRVARSLRRIWEYMNKTSPYTWKDAEVYAALDAKEPKNPETGKWLYPTRVYGMLSSLSTIFPNVLAKGHTMGLVRQKGELKDYFSFQEFDSFIAALSPTEKMSVTGWSALFKAHVNTGAREGTTKQTGILSLKWEDIDFSNKRCRIHDKGKRGVHGRLWQNIPLNQFEWLHGWQDLLEWRSQRGNPTNGFVFPVIYQEYLNKFHATRKQAGGRIAADLETLRLHVLRKTHAQWLTKLRVPIEWICGQFPDGWFGVGWDSPQILLGYYMTLEAEERFEIETKAQQRMEKLGLVSLSASPLSPTVPIPIEQQVNEVVKQ